jgi:hypothetical protein
MTLVTDYLATLPALIKFYSEVVRLLFPQAMFSGFQGDSSRVN